MSSAEEIDTLIRETEVKVIEQAFSEHQGGCATETCGGNRLDPCRMASLLDRLEGLKAAPHDPLMWFERTWVDVRTGDTVRIVGSDNIAYVRHAVHQGWHVDPRSSEYRPVAMEWTAVHVELTAGQQHDAAVLGVLDMDPTKPILIQLTRSEVDAIELLGGWRNRVGMTMTEIQPSV